MDANSPSSRLGISPEYEATLRDFARRYPRFFWQFNFWGGAGGTAIGLATVETLLPGAAVRPVVRLVLYVLAGAISAQLIQRRYRRSAPSGSRAEE